LAHLRIRPEGLLYDAERALLATAKFVVLHGLLLFLSMCVRLAFNYLDNPSKPSEVGYCFWPPVFVTL